VGSDSIASLSEGEGVAKQQDLVVSATMDASVGHRRQVQGVKAMASTSTNALVLLGEDNKTQEMPIDGSADPQSMELRSVTEAADYSSLFLSQMGPGLGSVLLVTNFSSVTGDIEG